MQQHGRSIYRLLMILFFSLLVLLYERDEGFRDASERKPLMLNAATEPCDKKNESEGAKDQYATSPHQPVRPYVQTMHRIMNVHRPGYVLTGKGGERVLCEEKRGGGGMRPEILRVVNINSHSRGGNICAS